MLLEHSRIALHRLDYSSGPTAEMAVALLLAAAKNLLPADRALRERRWVTRLPLRVLDGASALVLGYGAVGRRVAALCRALGMRVSCVRRNPAGEDQVHGPEALRHLLPCADALLLCLPSTPQTRGMLGATELALLKPGAVLVNVGRAEVIDDAALFDSLAQGHLFAAGLDVWPQEPDAGSEEPGQAASPHPFHTLENVVMSPHRAFRSEQAQEARIDALAEALRGAAAGRPLPGRVDVHAGY